MQFEYISLSESLVLMLLYIILNEQLICMKRPEYFSVLGSFHNLQVCPMLASVCFCDFYTKIRRMRNPFGP